MPELLATIILGSALAGETAFTIGGAAVTYGTLVSTAITIGVSAAAAGISIALAPDLPKGEGQHLTQNRTIPVRQAAYGRVRIGGAYMLYTAVQNVSYDVIALHQGKICGFVGHFLNDDRVIVISEAVVAVTLPDGTLIGSGQGSNDGRYIGHTIIQTREGELIEVSYNGVTAAVGSAVWGPNHRGDTIASLMLQCVAPSQEKFTRAFPAVLPMPSAIIDALPLWDFRDPAQDPDNPDTWIAYPDWTAGETVGAGVRRVYNGATYISRAAGNVGKHPDAFPTWWISTIANPVLQLVDYLLDPDHGMGLEFDTVIAPSLAALIVEANICDELVDAYAVWNNGTTYAANDLRIYNGSLYVSLADSNIGHQPDTSPTFWLFQFTAEQQEPRYTSNGVFTYDNDPADVIASILSTCHGWLSAGVGGAINLRVGRYTAPSVTIGAPHILGGEVRRGLAERDSVNELQITFTDPKNGYKREAAAAWRNEDDISRRGKVLSKQIDLSWVQSPVQARRLAKRQMNMLSAPLRGTLITTFDDADTLDESFAFLGQRYVNIDWPVHGLVNQPVEIQKVSVDLLAARFTIEWVAVEPATMDIYDPANETGLGPAPPVDIDLGLFTGPEDLRGTIEGTGASGYSIQVSFIDPERSDFTYALQYRTVDGAAPGPWSSSVTITPTIVGGRVYLSLFGLPAAKFEIQAAFINAAKAWSDWSSSIFLEPGAPALDFHLPQDSFYLAAI